MEPENPYKPKPLRYEPSMRERDLAFQIRLTDWGIMLFTGLLVLIVAGLLFLFGLWIYKMVMG